MGDAVLSTFQYLHFQWGNLFPMMGTLLHLPRALLLKVWSAGQQQGSLQNLRPRPDLLKQKLHFDQVPV